MCRNKLFLMLIFALFGAGPAVAETLHIDLELSAAHDSNVSRAESQSDIESDNLAALALSAKRSYVLSPNSGLLLSGQLGLTEYTHYSDLSHLSADIVAVYRLQPVVAYTAPWLELGGKLERLFYRDSDIRDGTIFDAHAALGKRFTDRIKAQVGLGWDHRWADESQVFELTHRRLFALADYQLNGNTALYANWSREYGDQAVTSSPNPGLSANAEEKTADTVFSGRNAYRVGAIANIYELGGSFSVNAANTVDLGVQRFEINSDGGGAYDGTELRASWLYRFR